MSKTASLSLLREDRYGLTVPFQRRKKVHFPMKCVPGTAPQTPSSAPNSQHPRDQTGELVILSTMPMS